MIDFHIHNTENNLTEIQDIIARGDTLGIDKMVLLADVFAFGAYPNELEVKQINDWTIEFVNQFAGKLYGFCFLNPSNSPEFVKSEIDRCYNAGLCGIKLEVSLNCRSSKLDVLMQKAEELDIPVLHHCWYKTTDKCEEESDPSDLADLARRFPEVNIIVAHLAGIRERGLNAIADYSNVFVDTSGGQPVADLVEYAVNLLGAERVIFGSDAYGARGRDQACQLGRVLGANISSENKDLILKLNAERLLKL
jgi:predicted TIM-barrel fold metal-dependent hydrolase